MTDRQERYVTSRRPLQIPNELLAQLEARRAARDRLVQAAVNALPALAKHAPELANALEAAIQAYAPGALKGDGTKGVSRNAITEGGQLNAPTMRRTSDTSTSVNDAD
jgi:hypothetical protein